MFNIYSDLSIYFSSSNRIWIFLYLCYLLINIAVSVSVSVSGFARLRKLSNDASGNVTNIMVDVIHPWFYIEQFQSPSFELGHPTVDKYKVLNMRSPGDYPLKFRRLHDITSTVQNYNHQCMYILVFHTWSSCFNCAMAASILQKSLVAIVLWVSQTNKDPHRPTRFPHSDSGYSAAEN